MIDYWKRYNSQADALNLKKKEVAAIVGLKYETFCNFQTADRIPKTEDAVKIARAIGASVEWMVTGEDTTGEDLSVDTLNKLLSQAVKVYKKSDSSDPVLQAVEKNPMLRKLVEYYIEAGEKRIEATVIGLGLNDEVKGAVSKEA